MNQLISDFIKGKLPKRKPENNDSKNDGAAQSKGPEKSIPRTFTPVGISNPNSEALNDILEEEISLGGCEEQITTDKHEKEKEAPASSGRKSSFPGLRRLKHRVSSLPDLRLRASSPFSKPNDEQDPTVNLRNDLNHSNRIRSPSTQSLRFSIQHNNNSSGSTLSTTTDTIASGNKSSKLRSWLHLKPVPKTDRGTEELKDGHSAILKQKVQINNVLSTPDAASLCSGNRSGSVSRSRSRSRSSKSTSRKHSREILGLTPISRSHSSELVGSRVGTLRRSTSSFAESGMKNSIGGQHTREASIDSNNENGLSKINVRRRRSRTIGTFEQHQSDPNSNKLSMFNNTTCGNFSKDSSTRGRSNSSSSNIYPGSNNNANPRNISNLASRRSNSLVTTLTNIMSLRSVTGLHSQRLSLPTPIPYDLLDKPPKPKKTDKVDDYLMKIVPVYQKYLALVLCAYEDTFLLSCLQQFMDKEFDFSNQPLDLSLRTVLLFLELPKESQQIERFLKCFSVSYYRQHCNAERIENSEPIWKDIEQLYFLTYSLLMLHTDSFNPNNKEKITKAEFVKLIHSDTECSGKMVPREYIEYLYENITTKEFPTTVLPPYDVEESINSQEKALNMIPETYSPIKIIKSQWLAQRPFLILGNKNNPATYQYSLTPPALPTGTMSSTSSSLSLFAIEDIDPYHYLINDSLTSITLRNFIDFEPSECLKTSTEIDTYGAKKLLSLRKEIKGGYLKFNKTQLLSKFKDINFEILDEDSDLQKGYLKVLKMGEIEMKVSTRKFSLVGNVVKNHWKTKFAILTTSFLFFFDSMSWLDPKIELDELTKTSNYIIDLSQPLSSLYEMEYCNNLFLTENKNTDPNVLSIVNQSQKRDIMFRNRTEALAWKNSIYFSGSIDGCEIEIAGLRNTFVVQRRTSVEDKILKLKSNHEQNMSKWYSLHSQLNIYLDTVPLSTKTRSNLIDHVNGIIKRIEMVSYQNERLDIYVKLLKLVFGLEPNPSEYNRYEANSIEESFLFNQ